MNESPQIEMPKYVCHKTVHALKIGSIVNQGGEVVIVPENTRYAPFSIDDAYIQKHKPSAGGYYVVYADGYKSFSPGQAFEEGYHQLT